MFYKGILKFLLIIICANSIQISFAQEIRVIDNKGTLKTAINNSVTTSATQPTPALEGDIWFDTSASPTTIKIYNDGSWINLSHTGTQGSVFFAAANGIPTENNTQLFWNNTTNTLKATNVSIPGTLLDSNGEVGTANQILSSTATGIDWITSTNWSITGNSGITTSNFLGTIDDAKMQIRSNNTPMLEIGRRQTLGLVAAQLDYTDTNQPLVYLRGNDVTSALQFAASEASFYKPMFFTTINGSFRLKGSSGATDFFEIGSAGPSNDGRLDFIIGDDGYEPIIFKSFNYRNGGFNKELFRVQGSEDSANAKTRFGININTSQVAVDTNYDDPQTGLNIANSTFQVNGSVSKSILTTIGALTLTEDHYTIVLGGNHTITLPNANTCNGRIYVIKNKNALATTISSFVNELGSNATTIKKNTTLWLQSDGANWQQITSKETITSLTQDNASATGEITFTDENGSTTGKAQVVSANAGNKISVGTDGGAYNPGRSLFSFTTTAATPNVTPNLNGSSSGTWLFADIIIPQTIITVKTGDIIDVRVNISEDFINNSYNSIGDLMRLYVTPSGGASIASSTMIETIITGGDNRYETASASLSQMFSVTGSGTLTIGIQIKFQDATSRSFSTTESGVGGLQAIIYR